MYTVHESYKIYILFYSAPEIKYIISFSLSLRASLSLSFSSHPLPRLSQSLKLSSSLSHSALSPSLSSLTVTLSISLIHRHRPNLTVPSRQSPHRHSPLSSSLSQAPSFTAAGPTQPSQAVDRLKPTPPTHPFCSPSSPTLCLFVIGDFVWSGLRKKIRDLVFFFFLLWTVDAGGVDGGCGCG